MASQSIVSRLARSNEENIRSQDIFDRQGRLRGAKSWPQKGIGVCMFGCPETAAWNGKNPFSVLETSQCSDTTSGDREFGKLQGVQAHRSSRFQPAFHGIRSERERGHGF